MKFQTYSSWSTSSGGVTESSDSNEPAGSRAAWKRAQVAVIDERDTLRPLPAGAAAIEKKLTALDADLDASANFHNERGYGTLEIARSAMRATLPMEQAWEKYQATHALEDARGR